MNDELLKDLVRKKNTKMDEIIRDAFKEHFGFPLESVTDKENLELREFQGSPILEFRYQDRTFLFWEKSDGVTMEDVGQDAIQVTMTSRFLKV